MPTFTIPLLGITVWWGDQTEISNLVTQELLKLVPFDFKAEFPKLGTGITGLTNLVNFVFSGGWRPPVGGFWADPPWLKDYFIGKPYATPTDLADIRSGVVRIYQSDLPTFSTQLRSKMDEVVTKQLESENRLKSFIQTLLSPITSTLATILDAVRKLWPDWLKPDFFKPLLTVANWLIDLATGKAVDQFYKEHPEILE